MTALLAERTPVQVAVDAAVLARVKRGMALLAEKYGAGFADHIDLEKLDMRFGSRCVLGQIYGEYDDGLAALSMRRRDREAFAYGFVCDDLSDTDDWAELTAAWLYALAEVQP